MFAHVNHAWICFWNQPVLSNEDKVFLLKETTESFAEAQTYDWKASTDYESEALPTVTRR